jgi:hypothetical protein
VDWLEDVDEVEDDAVEELSEDPPAPPVPPADGEDAAPATEPPDPPEVPLVPPLARSAAAIEPAAVVLERRMLFPEATSPTRSETLGTVPGATLRMTTAGDGDPGQRACTAA